MDVLIWRTLTVVLLALIGTIWAMQRSEIKSLKNDVKYISNTRYTKVETEQQITLRVDPLKEHMEEMRSDIKDIKNYLISGNKNG